MIAFLVSLLIVEPSTSSDDVGHFVRSLWLLQQRGSAIATDPQNDFELKARLAKALLKDNVITFNELGEFMTQDGFKDISRGDDAINAEDVVHALDSSTPASRNDLHAKARSHADYLTTTFDMIDEQHRKGAKQLSEWIVANYKPGRPLDVVVVCTGNSRRSILGSSMGNLAAAYYGLSDIRFHSGGTTPSAFNPRTISALKDIGFDVEATGEEALRGDVKVPNLRYRVQWGKGLEAIEFSKHYSDENNPQSGFAALMVCTEADEGCPTVQGASLRISMPYLDPKMYDDSPFEVIKYAERRDDIGRMMLSAMCQARSAIEAKRK